MRGRDQGSLKRAIFSSVCGLGFGNGRSWVLGFRSEGFAASRVWPFLFAFWLLVVHSRVSSLVSTSIIVVVLCFRWVQSSESHYGVAGLSDSVELLQRLG